MVNESEEDNIMAKKKTYGVPYQGSKNKLAEDIIALLPAGKRFVDLFAGGCAMTHAAILSGKWERVLCNDKYPLAQKCFQMAASGDFYDEKYYRFVGHEEFYERRFIDPWMIPVFGYQRGLSNTYVGKPTEQLMKDIGSTDIRDIPSKVGQNTVLKGLMRLQKLSGLDLSKADCTQMDYREYEFREGDVVYADPPYEGVGGYSGTEKFDHDAFWEWARTRDYPVYVSEYKAPSDFTSIWSKQRVGAYSRVSKSFKTCTEHIFVHSKWLKQGELWITC